MKNIILSAVALGLATVPSLAQTGKPDVKPAKTAPVKILPATPEELAEGKKRLTELISAHGGEAFLKLAALTLTGKGEATMPGAGGITFESLTLTYATPDRIRLDVVSAFGDVRQVIPGAGKKPFMVLAGQVQDPPFELRIPDPMSILREAVQRNLAVRPVPDRKEKDGAVSLGIALPDEPGKPSTMLYFDAEKKLVRRILLKVKGSTLTVNLGGDKTVDGVATPGSLDVFQGEDPLISMTFTKASVNPTLPEDFFSPPKEK